MVEQLDPLVTEYIKINYARAENFRNLLNGLDTGQFGSCGIKSLSPTQLRIDRQSGTSTGNQGVSQGVKSGSQQNQGGSQTEVSQESSRQE